MKFSAKEKIQKNFWELGSAVVAKLTKIFKMWLGTGGAIPGRIQAGSGRRWSGIWESYEHRINAKVGGSRKMRAILSDFLALFCKIIKNQNQQITAILTIYYFESLITNT